MTRRSFLHEQIGALRPLDFVAFIVEQPDGVGYVEIHRLEEDTPLRIEVGAEPALPPSAAALLGRLGLTAEEGAVDAAGAAVFTGRAEDTEAAAALADRALTELFGATEGTPLDVSHGSERAEAEATRHLARLRERLVAALGTLVAPGEVETDPDGDLTFPWRGTRLVVAPRVVDDGPALVRVMALTNLDVEPSPALGLFVAQTDFELEVGRLAYDGEDRVVWFELALVGDGFSDDDLAFALRFVATGAAELGDRIRSLFGGTVFATDDEAGSAVSGAAKGGTGPVGTGGYL